MDADFANAVAGRRGDDADAVARAWVDRRVLEADDVLTVAYGRLVLVRIERARPRGPGECTAVLRGERAAIARSSDHDAERAWLVGVIRSPPQVVYLSKAPHTSAPIANVAAAIRPSSGAIARSTGACDVATSIVLDIVHRPRADAAAAIRAMGIVVNP